MIDNVTPSHLLNDEILSLKITKYYWPRLRATLLSIQL